MNKVPVVFTAHGWGFSEGVGFFRENIIRISEKLASFLCRKIICVSNYDKNLAIEQNIVQEHKLLTIHNGVDYEAKATIKPDQTLETRGTIPIVFVGRLASSKNPEQLLQAFALLPKKVQSKGSVYIIGDGPKRRMLEHYIDLHNLKNRVHLMGEMSNIEVLTLLSKCENRDSYLGSIFTLISQYEGLPRSILEAMMFGFAIIATDVGGVSEEVSKNVGLLIKRNDIDSLKKSLEFLLNNPEKIKEYGENSIVRVRTEFSLKEMLFKTEQIYKDIYSFKRP